MPHIRTNIPNDQLRNDHNVNINTISNTIPNDNNESDVKMDISPNTSHTTSTMLDEYTIIDGDRKPFDVHRALPYVKCDEGVTGFATKHQIIKHLVDAINEVSNYGQHKSKAMEELLDFLCGSVEIF